MAKALLNKAITLRQAGRAAEALASYDELASRYGGREEAALAELVAQALFNKTTVLREAGREQEELAAYDEVVKR